MTITESVAGPGLSGPDLLAATRGPDGGREAAGLLSATYLHDRPGLVSGRFGTVATCELAAGLLDATLTLADPGAHALAGRGHDGGVLRRFGLTLGPGVVRVASTVRGDTADAWQDGSTNDERAMIEGTDSRSIASERRALLGDQAEPEGFVGRKTAIVSWSRKSRLNMARTMAALDWAGHLADAPEGWKPVMLTLTLPGDWQAVAPDRDAWNRIMERFWSRWQRAYGRPWAGAWKLEFQRRGAPHAHLYGVAPDTLAFRRWLSAAWTCSIFGLRFKLDPEVTWADEVLRIRDRYGDEVARSLVAGAGVDWNHGARASDPRKVALYFLKRSVGHNVGPSKEYQHQVPPEWLGVDRETGERLDETKSAGRFWGYRGMTKIAVTVELDDDQFWRIRRTIRRWCRANGRPLPAASVSRMQGYTLLHPDAPMLIAQLARWEALTWRADLKLDQAAADTDGVA